MRNSLEPKIVIDIRPRRQSVFSSRKVRVNLSAKSVFSFPLTHWAKVFVVCLTMLLFVGIPAFAPTATPFTVQGAAREDETERQALEAQLKELEKEIDEYENQIIGYQKQGSSLKGEITKLNNKIAKLNLQIRAINLTLAQLDRKIGDTESRIGITQETITANKRAIQALLAKLYQNEQTGIIEIFLQKPRLSDFFNDLNGIALVKSNLQVALREVSDLHGQLVEQKTQLSLARADAATVKAYQDSQREETERAKGEKNTLLAVTKGQESKYQTLLKKTKETAAQIRSRIFQLLGGGELSFVEAYSYAKLAGSATGVRPALLLAVLDRESALGRNVGRCSYRTATSPKERPIFLEITAALNIDPETVTVSCPNADGAYGGAMGPAQFIPSTWRLYENEISKITGRGVVSPWNNADAFVATALYLRDAGAVSASLSDERKAAARYYAGSRWRSYLWTYGEAVISRATRFQEDISTITAS